MFPTHAARRDDGGNPHALVAFARIDDIVTFARRVRGRGLVQGAQRVRRMRRDMVQKKINEGLRNLWTIKSITIVNIVRTIVLTSPCREF